MATARFCPQCGAKTVPQANFCAACGEVLPGARKSAGRRADASSWQALAPGIGVLVSYLVVGTGLWFAVLRSQPFPAVTSSAGGLAPSGGSQQLPQNHPPLALPEEVKKRIAELVEKANAAPQDVQAWKTLAEVQFRASQVDASYRSAALASYRHVLELVPNDPDALRGVGNVYYDLEEYAKAIEYYQRYLAQKPEDLNVRTDLGTMYLYSNDIDRAVAEYQTVIEKDPSFFQAHFNLGIAYHERGQSEKARESLLRAKSLASDQNIQARIDQVLAQLNGSAVPSTSVSSAEVARSPFQQAVERILRDQQIMGQRITRIEWLAAAEARVFLQNFPMDGMPAEIRGRLVEKLRSQIAEAKRTAGMRSTARVDLIDADTQKIMETINS